MDANQRQSAWASKLTPSGSHLVELACDVSSNGSMSTPHDAVPEIHALRLVLRTQPRSASGEPLSAALSVAFLPDCLTFTLSPIQPMLI